MFVLYLQTMDCCGQTQMNYKPSWQSHDINLLSKPLNFSVNRKYDLVINSQYQFKYKGNKNFIAVISDPILLRLCVIQTHPYAINTLCLIWRPWSTHNAAWLQETIIRKQGKAQLAMSDVTWKHKQEIMFDSLIQG